MSFLKAARRRRRPAPYIRRGIYLDGSTVDVVHLDCSFLLEASTGIVDHPLLVFYYSTQFHNSRQIHRTNPHRLITNSTLKSSSSTFLRDTPRNIILTVLKIITKIILTAPIPVEAYDMEKRNCDPTS